MERSTARIAAVSLFAARLAHDRKLATPDLPTLNGGQIWFFLWVDHSIELEAGQLAENRARDPRVKALARRMAQQHEEAMRSLESAAAGIIAINSEDVESIKGQARRDLTRLGAIPAGAFDAAFLRDQEEASRTLLEDLDRWEPYLRHPLMVLGFVAPALAATRELAARDHQEAAALLKQLLAH